MICRPATPGDLGFVVETFTLSFRAASTHSEGLSKERTGQLIKNLLANGWTATVLESEGYLVGWAVHGERNRLAWIYLREIVRTPRETGVARFFLERIGVDTSKRITTPFLPNRLKRRWDIAHRPFECVP